MSSHWIIILINVSWTHIFCEFTVIEMDFCLFLPTSLPILFLLILSSLFTFFFCVHIVLPHSVFLMLKIFSSYSFLLSVCITSYWFFFSIGLKYSLNIIDGIDNICSYAYYHLYSINVDMVSIIVHTIHLKILPGYYRWKITTRILIQ